MSYRDAFAIRVHHRFGQLFTQRGNILSQSLRLTIVSDQLLSDVICFSRHILNFRSIKHFTDKVTT